MIQGTVKQTEAQYRAKMLDSSSSLKDFATNRKKYYRKYILNEPIEEDETSAIITGQVVETLLLEPNLFDLKFHMSACASVPSGLMGAFCEALYKYTIEATNEEGVVMRDFADISQDAYVASGFKIKYAAVIEKFAGSDAEIYFNEILKVRQNNLTVVTTLDVTNAEKIVEELKTNFVTKDIVNLVSSDKWTVHQQLQVEGYKIGGLQFKSMMDLVHLDHVNKSIQVWDLKTVWSVENFYSEYYLKRLAYIQAFVYHMAIRHYRDENFPGYAIQPIKFIVCDSTNYYNPLIYALTFDDLKEARDGFEYKGRKYTGTLELVKDLEWALSNNVWNFSRVNYESNGVVPLKK